MESKEEDTHEDASKRNYDYIEVYRKTHELVLADPNVDAEGKAHSYHYLLEREAIRDYHIESLRQINNLLQIDQKPNLELTEPKEELFKISVSFQPKGMVMRIWKKGRSYAEFLLSLFRDSRRRCGYDWHPASRTISKCRRQYKYGCYVQ